MLCPKCQAGLREVDSIRGQVGETGFTCWRCGFWVDADKIKGVVVATAKKREQSRLCKVPGCGKYQVKDRMCKAHYNEAARFVEEDAAPAPEPEALPQDFGTVTNVQGEKVAFGVDPLLYSGLRNSLAELEARWLVELSGLKPMTAICRCAQMIDAVGGL